MNTVTPRHKTPMSRRRKWAYWLIGAFVGLGVLSALAGSEDEPGQGTASSTVTGAATSTAAEQTQAAPDYKIIERPRDAGQGFVVVEVDSKTGLRQVFDAVRARFDENDRGFRVQIVCSTGATESPRNVLANGVYANGATGAAQTGLEEGAVEFEPQADTSCPGKLAPGSASPKPTDTQKLRQAMAALNRAGLAADNLRDRQEGCAELGCTARIVGDQLSMTLWPDEESAKAMSGGGNVGRIGVTFSRSRVPASKEAAYLQAIRQSQ